MLLANKQALPLFFLLAGLVALSSSIIIQSQWFSTQSDLLAMAVTADLTFVIPLAYVIIARRSKLPIISVIPVFLLSILLASFLLPAHQHQYLDVIKLLAGPAELAAIAFIVYKLRKGIKEVQSHKALHFDFAASLEKTLKAHVKHRRARALICTEIAVFYYGLFAWRGGPEQNPKTQSFSYHRKSLYSLFVLALICAATFEGIAIHFLLAQWSTVVAWLLTGLSVYGLVFLLADFNAARKRTIFIEDDVLVIRIGLRWQTRICIDDIAAITCGAPSKSQQDNAYLKAVLIGDSNLLIELKTENTASGLYGIIRSFDRIGLAVDEPEELRAALNCAIANSRQRETRD